jgi:hypothetical protein
MTRYFLQDTPLADLEREMMRPPGFQKRGGGKRLSCHINLTTCDCGRCLKSEEEKRPCGAFNCICFEDHLAEGCRIYSELVSCWMAEAGISALMHRTRAVFQDTEFPYRDVRHREAIRLLWQREILCEYQMPAAFASAVYLLTADPELWNKAGPAVESCRILFHTVNLRGLDIEGYVLHLAAKSLYLGRQYISITELCDPEIISDEIYRLIMTACTIRRYGLPIMDGLERSF